MKLYSKYFLHLGLIIVSLVLSSCGKKNNRISSISGSSPFFSGNPALSGSAGSTIVNQVQSLRANVGCLNGNIRLTNDVSFFINGGAVSGTRIGGNWQQGFLSNGTISKMWVGVSAFRDLMFVTQVANNSQVIGFNVTLSFCELKNQAPGFPSIISNERALRNFQASEGIVLDSNTYCGYSVVDLARNTTIVSERNLSNPLSPPDALIPTSFTKPTCNGQF